jgi:hypothetical protein
MAKRTRKKKSWEMHDSANYTNELIETLARKKTVRESHPSKLNFNAKIVSFIQGLPGASGQVSSTMCQ